MFTKDTWQTYGVPPRELALHCKYGDGGFGSLLVASLEDVFAAIGPAIKLKAFMFASTCSRIRCCKRVQHCT